MSRNQSMLHRVILVAGLPVALALTLVVAVGASSDRDEGEELVLTGEYNWTGGSTQGDLRAVFHPTGDGTWDVDFHFRFRGRPHKYTGTAEGSMTGRLEGTVKNENRRRTFSFAGDFEDEVLYADHWEIGPGGEQSTGTMTLE